MTPVLFVLWLVTISSHSDSMKSIPSRTFPDAETCLRYVSEFQQSDTYRTNVEELNKLGTNVSLICLPAGVRP